MEADRIKWNQRFASQPSFLSERPSPFLAREIERILGLISGRRALDIACGEGRNSVFLAQQGFQVTGLDISDVGLEKARQRAAAAGVTVDYRRVDLEGYRFTEGFDLIVNFNFLLRDLIPLAYAALVPGGVLIVDTIMESAETTASHNPAYLLGRGELARICGGFAGEVVYLEEVEEDDMPTARVLFRKGE
jgi:2-polyprenyl-3-methyl-5-hydroxy-6-metoxy-1,4-benzoquinol methylase